jgi:hypothetical protein
MFRRNFILILLVLSNLAAGQALYQNPLYKLYYESVSVPQELINGKEYLPYYFHSKSKTTPLLFSGEVFNATLKIKGRMYRNTGLQYDTYLDELIYIDTSRIIDNMYPRIALNKDIVDGFSFVFKGDSMKFRYLKFPDKELTDGFYEIAYDGGTRFMIRHRSTQYNFDAIDEYKYLPERYIVAMGKCYEIKNNGSFLKIFGQQSDKMKEYLRKSRIKIRQADKNDIVGVLAYFDSLSKTETAVN